MAVNVVHITEEELGFYVLGRLTRERTSAVELHLGDCPACCDLLTSTLHSMTGVAEPGNEKRASPRFRTDDTGFMQSLNPLSFERVVVRIINVSKDGMGLVADKSIDLGSLVQVRMGKIVAIGKVRYCAEVEEHFQVGLLFSDVIK